MDTRGHASGDSARIVLPGRGWHKLHDRPGRTVFLVLIGLLAAVAGLVGAVRRVGEFQRLDFRTVRVDGGYLVVEVMPRSGAARAGLTWGDLIVALEGTPADSVQDFDRGLFGQRVSALTILRDGKTREVSYYPPPPQVDVRYLLVAFAAMFTLAVAGVVYLGHPTPHTGRFLLLAEALFPAVVISIPIASDATWQWLLLLRDFGRLALPPLLVVFFACFPTTSLRVLWQYLAFLPSLVLAVLRTGLTVGWLPPLVGNLLLQDACDRASVVLAIAGVAGATVLGLRSYFHNRADPTRRRQVEWVALGAAAGFTPYLMLTLIPQLAGADLEVLAWISLLPLALVPLGIASSLLEFRLWDLEDITRQVVATGLAVVFGGVSFAFLNYAVTQFGFRLGNWRNLFAVAGGVLLATLTVPARRILLETFERVQYRERLAARRALTTFAEEAVAHREPEALLARLTQLLKDALAVDKVVTYLALGDRLYPSNASERWPVLSAASVQEAFPTEDEKPLREGGLWHRFAMERDGRVVGVVYCGRRFGELPFGHGERRLVGALTAQAALALENTLLMADLRRQVQEHRLLEDYLERIFQFSAAALLICDASGRILRANERACSLLDRTSDDMAGEFLHRIVDMPEECKRYLPSDLAGVQGRFVARGKERVGVISTSALEVEPGRFDGRVVALDDISDQLLLEQRLAQQERLAALGRLAAGLAHEVNTPVTGISSYAQLLRELTPTGDPRAPLVQKLEEQSFRVARIVTNLLELARPSGFERALINLAEIARDEVVQMRSEADQQGVAIGLSAPDEVSVDGNRVQIELVVHNLLRNALQATPRGGTVDIEVGRENGQVWMQVSDTGPGVPEEFRDAIFEPFVTTKQGRGGTGLGLAITRDIIKAHGGSIKVLTNVPNGTIMRVEFPQKGNNA